QTIRHYGGLAPFCAIAESAHDIMGAGHASTSIGYAVGIKEAMRQRGEVDSGRVVAVIGDGAMTGGVAFEAIHQAGGLGTPIVVVLNDNGMSIAPNVGALSRYFNRIRLNPRLWHARDGIEGGLTKLPGGIGAAFERLGPQLKESIKAFAAPGLLWEELDWVYVGVIDGHDVRALRAAIRDALAAQRPVVVHIATVKGKGFAPAEDGGLEGMEKWHAAKPRSIANGDVVKSAPASTPDDAPPPPPQYTTVFGNALLAECRRNPRVVGITAAMNSGTGLNILQAAMPERYFDVGIAEQQAVLFAAGLALEGARPVAAIYSTFLQRAYDQIVHDVCLQRLPVVFAMDRAGLVGDDGPTHHGAFDIAYLRCIPNIVAMAPRDEAMLVHMLHTALDHDGPTALRYPRGEAVGVPLPEVPQLIPIGTGEILREAPDGAGRAGRVALLGYGTGVGKALGTAALLELAGIQATVADARFAKPIDSGLVAQLAAEHELLVTIEEGVLGGGFGSAVWETLNEAGGAPSRILRVG
ncbi:MAG: 1-deoxy-D-xylulose-5-phosphate synthase, partial [Solirubrobacteraceae bacterium]